MNAVEQRLSGLVFDLLLNDRAYCNQLYWLMKNSDYDVLYSTDFLRLENTTCLHVRIKSPLKDEYQITIAIDFRTTETYPRPSISVKINKNNTRMTAVNAVMKFSPIVHQALSELADVLGVARI